MMTELPEPFYRAINAAIEGGFSVMDVFESGEFDTKLKGDNSPVTKADLDSSEVISEILEATKIPILSEEGTEDTFEERKKWDLLLVVDPLDGTKEFIKRTNEFSVNIGCVENGVAIFGVIYIPVSQEVFFGGTEYGAFKLDYDDEKPFSRQIENAVRLKPPSKNKEVLIVTGGSEAEFDFYKNAEVLKSYTYDSMEFQKLSSAIKFCRIAEGVMDIYPRDYPCMEWDTAAGQAILNGIGKDLYDMETGKIMRYNKESLYVPFFIVA
mgnify:FL=1